MRRVTCPDDCGPREPAAYGEHARAGRSREHRRCCHGQIAYYAPRGNVAIYYKDGDCANGRCGKPWSSAGTGCSRSLARPAVTARARWLFDAVSTSQCAIVFRCGCTASRPMGTTTAARPLDRRRRGPRVSPRGDKNREPRGNTDYLSCRWLCCDLRLCGSACSVGLAARVRSPHLSPKALH